jgi:hypothetical protein
MALTLEGFADVVDGQILLAKGEDQLADVLLLGDLLSPFLGRGEEWTMGVFPEVMEHDAKASVGISEAFGGFHPADPIDEIGPEGFVASVCGVLWLEENVRQIRYLILFTCTHTITISQ